MKIILLITFLTCFVINAQAAQCPSSSDWSHKSGEQWILSDTAIKEGWRASSNSSADAYTTMPESANLSVQLSYGNCIECEYHITPNDIEIASMKTQTVDYSSLSMPPFQSGPWPLSYSCSTVAGTPAVCQWSWK